MHHRRTSSTTSTASQFSLFDTVPLRSSFQQPMPQHLLAHTSMTAQKPPHTNTFVHKLYNMVIDSQYQHLIAWNYTGSSFIVCNIMEFSRDVLPKHFKHNNFSSFVRQLNMYGFHKVNKSPRGHRTLAENQIWEFSHPKFLRDRSDLLDDIKRKAMESATDNARRDAGDLNTHMAMMQVTQSDMMQQIGHLYENFNGVVKELTETRRKQDQHQQMMKFMMHYITQRNGGHVPQEFHSDPLAMSKVVMEERPPPIFVTSHDPTSSGNVALLQDMLMGARDPITGQHQQHQQHQTLPPASLSLGHYNSPLPPSPSPSTMVSDDELDVSSPLYTPHSPFTPSHSRSQSSSSHYTESLKPSSAQGHSHRSDGCAQYSFSNPLDPLSH
ncbi:HSF-type DNA-binding-domain-containing protein [Spinellus fusiger]|nr:HSF-type DNA-binding-domain-containing protein [Spinellus fusiger]